MVEATVASTAVGIMESASIICLALYKASNLAFKPFEFDSSVLSFSSNLRQVASYWLLMFEIQLDSITRASISAYSSLIFFYAFDGDFI